MKYGAMLTFSFSYDSQGEVNEKITESKWHSSYVILSLSLAINCVTIQIDSRVPFVTFIYHLVCSISVHLFLSVLLVCNSMAPASNKCFCK